jgi:hypothetical protein
MSSGSASMAARAPVREPIDDVGQLSCAFCAASSSSSLSG